LKHIKFKDSWKRGSQAWVPCSGTNSSTCLTASPGALNHFVGAKLRFAEITHQPETAGSYRAWGTSARARILEKYKPQSDQHHECAAN
jgi:hypothetical protein